MDSKLEILNEYIIEELGMELQDTRINEVVDEIEGWEKQIGELKEDDIRDSNCQMLDELRQYKDYKCLYSIDAEYGGISEQGYIIVDNALEYKGFVRTI